MTSSANNMNVASRKMPPVLFPSRRFAIIASLNDPLAESTSTLGNDDDLNAIKWTGMNPLEMISHLARATEQVEANKGIEQVPIIVGNTKLSSATPSVPILQKKKPQLRKKRNNESADDIMSVTTIKIEDDEPTVSLAPWDLKFLVEQDEHATEAANHLHYLARTVEGMPHYELVGGSYQRIRAHIEGTTTWIHSAYSDNLGPQRAAEKMSLLQQLYSEVIQQMQALVEMTSMLGQTEEDEQEAATKMEEDPNPLSHVEFSEYMNNWLRDNWINPYPDDQGLVAMASHCGRTPVVISNWLINARTRKWRPAVIRAFEMKRPAGLLLEDAINIFDDKPLRQLTSYDTGLGEAAPDVQTSAAPDFVMANKRRKMY